MSRNISSVNIKPHIRSLIFENARRYRNRPRSALAIELQERIKDMGEPVPTRETLEKMISSARNSSSPQDEPWSMITLEEFPLNPESLPYVYKAWMYYQQYFSKPDQINLACNPVNFTIRMSKWAARLYCIFKHEDIVELTYWSMVYAEFEKAMELTNNAMPSVFLDIDLHNFINHEEIDQKLVDKIINTYEISERQKIDFHKLDPRPDLELIPN